ncbi:probable aspartyl protease At4g16563 [Magnolia sinica]|uniref:probable aspartyl protease At4g16563 n=1 Tax=Magnolia sinica TaxID=86752 RepID=UPI00265AD501|nr:probable aspartyl protease At4g16563 [Magnolia sinica]
MGSSHFLFLSFSFLSSFLFITSSLSTSPPLIFPLTHTLSKTQLTKTHHLLKSISTRPKNHRHRPSVSLPLSPGSDYTLSISLGPTPSQPITLYLDTGSDLVWFPCAPFECILCENKPGSSVPPPKIASAAFVPCNSAACSAAHSSLTSSHLCAIAGCPLETIETADCSPYRCPPVYYAYGDGSLIARLRRDRLSIPTSNSSAFPTLQLPNFTFGCAHVSLGEPIGVAGFGRGPLSLPAQLSVLSPDLGSRFSYCLISHSFDADRLRRPSPLILGRSLSISEGDVQVEFIYTPMLENPKHPYFYCVGLKAVTVGKYRIPATSDLMQVDGEGNGGMVIDSGTTFTMLPERMYGMVMKKFDLGIGGNYKRATEVEEEMGMGLCYYYEGKENVKVPKIVLHFVGNGSVVLPRKNYFLGFEREKRKVGCVMLMNGGDLMESGGGPAATLGNFQQQGFEVVYDLEQRRVGFARRQCASLWESLTRG